MSPLDDANTDDPCIPPEKLSEQPFIKTSEEDDVGVSSASRSRDAHSRGCRRNVVISIAVFGLLLLVMGGLHPEVSKFAKMKAKLRGLETENASYSGPPSTVGTCNGRTPVSIPAIFLWPCNSNAHMHTCLGDDDNCCCNPGFQEQDGECQLCGAAPPDPTQSTTAPADVTLLFPMTSVNLMFAKTKPVLVAALKKLAVLVKVPFSQDMKTSGFTLTIGDAKISDIGIKDIFVGVAQPANITLDIQGLEVAIDISIAYKSWIKKGSGTGKVKMLIATQLSSTLEPVNGHAEMLHPVVHTEASNSSIEFVGFSGTVGSILATAGDKITGVLSTVIADVVGALLVKCITGPSSVFSGVSNRTDLTLFDTTLFVQGGFLKAQAFQLAPVDCIGLSYRFSVGLAYGQSGIDECPYPYLDEDLPYYDGEGGNDDATTGHINVADRVFNCIFHVIYKAGLLKGDIAEPEAGEEPPKSIMLCAILPDLCEYYGLEAPLTGNFEFLASPLLTTYAPNSQWPNGILGGSFHVKVKMYVEGACPNATGASCMFTGCARENSYCSINECFCNEGYCVNGNGECQPAAQHSNPTYALTIDAKVFGAFSVTLSQPEGNSSVLLIPEMQDCTLNVDFLDPGIGQFSPLSDVAKDGLASSLICTFIPDMIAEKAKEEQLKAPFPVGWFFDITDGSVKFKDGFISLDQSSLLQMNSRRLL